MGGPKLLCLCDSPTLQTGFARVSYNLISRWLKTAFFEQIWVWGIGYNGFPHHISGLENRICPASTHKHDLWYDPVNLNRFVKSLDNDAVGETPGGFTHVFILQDTFALAGMAGKFADACRRNNVASWLYFPVDAPLAAAWTPILAAVDVPVAYGEYGRSEAGKALLTPMADRAAFSATMAQMDKAMEQKGLTKPQRQSIKDQRADELRKLQTMDQVDELRRSKIAVLKTIPHGADTTIYHPITEPKAGELSKFQARQEMFHGLVGPTDFLMINVSQHQKRKGLAQSLIVLRDFKALRPDLAPKLYLHMSSSNPDEGTNLREVSKQLGLVDGEDVFYADHDFANGHALKSESTLNVIYNAADLLLTTSYGEGWGCPITEAMAAGLPVAGPRHTSISEIMGEGRGILFGTLGHDMIIGDNSRLRPRTDTNDAARRIIEAIVTDPEKEGSLSSHAIRALAWVRGDFLNWDRIAGEWMEMFKAASQESGRGVEQRRRGT
jgi:glycosyltransferase involved in cell wall biosynthesis